MVMNIVGINEEVSKRVREIKAGKFIHKLSNLEAMYIGKFHKAKLGK